MKGPSQFTLFCSHLAELQRTHKEAIAVAAVAEFLPLGEELVLNLLRIVKKGEEFACSLDLNRMEEAVAAYRSILEPPQVLGISCLIRRSGPAFEKKAVRAFMKAAHAVFISRCHLVNSRLQNIINSGQRFTNIVNIANSIINTLSNITMKGIGEKALLSASKKVERFVLNYFDELLPGSNNIKLEALRRIRIVEQKKMLASLQEIMNTAMSKCQTHINSNVNAVQCIEKFVNDSLGAFKSRMKMLESSADALKIWDEIYELSEEVAIRHSELTGQLVEGLSLWEEVSALLKTGC